MFDIITIGSATRDVFLRSQAVETHAATHTHAVAEQCFPLGGKVSVDELDFATGGGATNAAVTFARLGKQHVACVFRIGGDDGGGRAILADLKRERIDTRFIQHDAKRYTAYSVILLAGSGERTVLVYRGASHAVAAREIPWTRLRTRWFYVTSLGGDLALVRRILAHARRIGAKVAWNPGGGEIKHGWNAVASLAAQCSVFNLNREEAAQLTGRDGRDIRGMLRVLCETPPTPPNLPSQRERRDRARSSPSRWEGEPEGVGCIVLLTDGAGGAYACGGSTTLHIASRNLIAINTTGAGDAFGSAFVLGLIGRAGTPPRPYDTALRLAMANAEGVITHMGAKAGILSRMPSRVALAKYRVREL